MTAGTECGMQRRQAPVLVARRAITQRTYDHFNGRAFAWGDCDCSHIIAWHLRAMGHAPRRAAAGRYRTALGAKRALMRMGAASFGELLDAMGLPRIAPATALPGDIIELHSADVLPAMTVALGNGALLGFVEGQESAGPIRAEAYVAAWRVEPSHEVLLREAGSHG